MKYAAVIATVSAFASDGYCPAGSCYKDSGTWNPTSNGVTCTYDPDSNCIVPTCSASGLAATFSPDLFHTNEFGCKFYSDESRAASSEITSTNIVNMGVNIYGEVTSTALLGLSYKLTAVTISNNSGDEFSPIANSAGDPLVNGAITSDNPTETGNNILFEYLSFGFEQNSGKDQNQVNIKCHISLTVPDSDEEGSS